MSYRPKFLMAVSALLVVLFVAGCSTTSNNASNTPAPNVTNNATSSKAAPATTATTHEITMTAQQFAFSPSSIQVNLGDTVILHVTSTDVQHGIVLPDFNVNQQLPPGQTKTVTFVANKKGTFEFSCDVPCGPGHREMTGSITVS